MTPTTAVVILNWNGAKMLREYLPSVLLYSRDEARVIVADNASTDDSIAMLEHHFPQVEIIRLEQNWGFAEGYNKALSQVEADYYVLLNSDVEVTHHWLTPLIEFMESHPDVAATQPKLLSVFNRDSFEYAGASGGFVDPLGYPFCRGRVFDTVERDNGQYDYAQEVMWATGAALCIRARDYNKVGGLDGRFFAHCEEIDLCWRLRIMGKQVWAVPESTVYHVGGGTLPQGNPRKTFLNFRNNLTMLYKCLPETELQRVMRLRLLLDGLAALQMLLLKRSPREAWAVVKGRRAFSQWKKEFADDRAAIQASRVERKESPQCGFSLLWQYYAKGRKLFCDLPFEKKEADY